MNVGITDVFEPTLRIFGEPATNTQFSRIVPLFMATPEFAESLRTISTLAKLPANWDSYGSPAVQTPAVQRAVEVLAACQALCPTAPRIVPVAGGGLQIEWDVKSRELEIEVLPNGSIEVLMVEGEMMIETPLPAERVYPIIPMLLNWLSAENPHATAIR
ncbi:MAG TPA: hypothetical protein VKV95_04450 [Terriglobia bacterium]|nr:hypothetical protein [Terriglobia bacterium]